MTSESSGPVIAKIAEWIDETYKDSKRVISMIATTDSRFNAANAILEEHGSSGPSFNKMFAGIVDPSEKHNEIRLSALREALGELARGKYKNALNTGNSRAFQSKPQRSPLGTLQSEVMV